MTTVGISKEKRKNRNTTRRAMKGPSNTQPLSHIPSVAVLLSSSSFSVRVVPAVLSPADSLKCRLAATQEQFSNTAVYIHHIIIIIVIIPCILNISLTEWYRVHLQNAVADCTGQSGQQLGGKVLLISTDAGGQAELLGLHSSLV